MAARRLQTYTSLWAMMPHDDSGETLAYDAICEMVAGAGYDFSFRQDVLQPRMRQKY